MFVKSVCCLLSHAVISFRLTGLHKLLCMLIHILCQIQWLCFPMLGVDLSESGVVGSNPTQVMDVCPRFPVL
jgi:hypothetical protein